jgi:hypothetical protein
MGATSGHQFAQYLLRRGYKVPPQTPDIIRRWWLSSFAQPGFAKFWRVWNPYIGFWLLKLYRKLGGDRHRGFACLATFGFAGFCHDLLNFILEPQDGLELFLTIAFLIWGIIVLATSPRSVRRTIQKLPVPVHVCLNLACLCLGLLGAHFAWEFLSDTY